MKYTNEAFEDLVKQAEQAEKKILANVRKLPIKGITADELKALKWTLKG
jgi:hypothetical protein